MYVFSLAAISFGHFRCNLSNEPLEHSSPWVCATCLRQNICVQVRVNNHTNHPVHFKFTALRSLTWTLFETLGPLNKSSALVHDNCENRAALAILLNGLGILYSIYVLHFYQYASACNDSHFKCFLSFQHISDCSILNAVTNCFVETTLLSSRWVAPWALNSYRWHLSIAIAQSVQEIQFDFIIVLQGWKKG